MWNRRKEEEPVPNKPTSAPPRASELAKEGIPMSTLPSRASEPAFEPSRGGNAAVLGKSVNVKGQIFSREDLTIDGEVEGTVECHDHRLTIGPNARVQAALKAREIVIQGSIQGNVEAADKIDLKKEAKLVGDIKTSRIVIEDGAYFKGSIDISKATPAPKSAQAQAQPAQTTAAAATAATGTPVTSVK